MNYDQINYLLAKIFSLIDFPQGKITFRHETYLAMRNVQPWILAVEGMANPYSRLKDESTNRDLIIDLAQTLLDLDLSLGKPIQLNISDELKTEVTLTQASAPKTYIFRVTPLNPYEKLTKLGKSFDEI